MKKVHSAGNRILKVTSAAIASALLIEAISLPNVFGEELTPLPTVTPEPTVTETGTPTPEVEPVPIHGGIKHETPIGGACLFIIKNSNEIAEASTYNKSISKIVAKQTGIKIKRGQSVIAAIDTIKNSKKKRSALKVLAPIVTGVKAILQSKRRPS